MNGLVGGLKNEQAFGLRG